MTEISQEKDTEVLLKKLSETDGAERVSILADLTVALRELDSGKVIEFGQQVIAIAENLNVPDLIMNCNEAFSTIHEEKGNFREALEYYKRFKELNDKTFTEESNKKYNELQVSYDTEKKEKENEIYRLKNIELAKANEKLKKALGEVKKLSGMLPICSSCKKIRDDSGYWKQIEEYISEHSDTHFTHGLCPDCVKKLYTKNEEE